MSEPNKIKSQVNEEQNTQADRASSPLPAQVEGLATSRPSDLAVAISEAINSTPNHAEAIDRVIAEHSTICCSYCGGISYKGLAVVDGQWTDKCREAMADHILTCAKRPEKILLDERDSTKAKIEALTAALVKAKETIRAFNGIGFSGELEEALWEAYQVSPEMKQINAALALVESPETKD